MLPTLDQKRELCSELLKSIVLIGSYGLFTYYIIYIYIVYILPSVAKLQFPRGHFYTQLHLL